MTTWLVAKNSAESALAADISDVATSLTVTTGEGAKFPSTFPFRVSIDSEIIQVGARTTDTLSSLTRAQESTTGATHSEGATVELRLTAGGVTQLQDHEALKISAAVHPNTAMARAYLSANQENLVHNTATKVNLNAETYDTGSNFNVATYKYVTPVAGYYLTLAQVAYLGSSVVVDKRYDALLYVAGAAVAVNYLQASVADYIMCSVHDIRHIAATTDIELYARHTAGVDTVDVFGGATATFMTVVLLQAD